MNQPVPLSFVLLREPRVLLKSLGPILRVQASSGTNSKQKRVTPPYTAATFASRSGRRLSSLWLHFIRTAFDQLLRFTGQRQAYLHVGRSTKGYDLLRTQSARKPHALLMNSATWYKSHRCPQASLMFLDEKHKSAPTSLGFVVRCASLFGDNNNNNSAYACPRRDNALALHAIFGVKNNKCTMSTTFLFLKHGGTIVDLT